MLGFLEPCSDLNCRVGQAFLRRNPPADVAIEAQLVGFAKGSTHPTSYSSSSAFSSSDFSPFSLAGLSAVPRMSPSVAPESEEPYWAIASFSSATSSALMDTVILWLRRANRENHAS